MKSLTTLFGNTPIGALLFAALGIGLFAFLPETIVSVRWVFAAAVVLIGWETGSRYRHPALRFGIPGVAAALMIVLLSLHIAVGAKIALGGGFVLLFCSILPNMLIAQDKRERAVIGAAGIAALLLGVVIWVKCDRINLTECRLLFSAAALAGALTLFLQSFNRGEK